jgi:hypothetical protein
MRTVSPVSPIFNDKNDGIGWLLAAVVALLFAIIALIAGTAMASTEAPPEEKDKVVCRAVYEGAGQKELARYDLTIDVDPADFKTEKVSDVVKILVDPNQKWTSKHNINIPAGTVAAKVVCPLIDGELTVLVTKTLSDGMVFMPAK